MLIPEEERPIHEFDFDAFRRREEAIVDSRSAISLEDRPEVRKINEHTINDRLAEIGAMVITTYRLVNELPSEDIDRPQRLLIEQLRNRIMKSLPSDEIKEQAVQIADAMWEAQISGQKQEIGGQYE